MEEPNPDTPKIKYAPKMIIAAKANERGSMNSKMAKSQQELFRQALLD